MNPRRRDAALIGLVMVALISIFVASRFLSEQPTDEIGATASEAVVSGADRILEERLEGELPKVVEEVEPAPDSVVTEVPEDAPEAALEPVLGVVVDARTGQPVPEIDVWLRAGEFELQLATGEDGAFRTTRALDPSVLEIEMTDLGVEGMMISPGYAYDKAPDQEHFLRRKESTNQMFEMILSNRKKRWNFNQSPLFLEFLMGRRDYECTPWGNPTYNLFGWQKPCYLLQEGYADSFDELIKETDWDAYGRASGNPKCQDCMVHCGYEPTAVDHTFSSFGGMWGTIKGIIFNKYANPAAKQKVDELAKQRSQKKRVALPVLSGDAA